MHRVHTTFYSLHSPCRAAYMHTGLSTSNAAAIERATLLHLHAQPCPIHKRNLAAHLLHHLKDPIELSRSHLRWPPPCSAHAEARGATLLCTQGCLQRIHSIHSTHRIQVKHRCRFAFQGRCRGAMQSTDIVQSSALLL